MSGNWESLLARTSGSKFMGVNQSKSMDWRWPFKHSPVARLTPIVEETRSLEYRLIQLEQHGWIETLKSKTSKLPPPLHLPGNKAQEFLQEDRNS